MCLLTMYVISDLEGTTVLSSRTYILKYILFTGLHDTTSIRDDPRHVCTRCVCIRNAHTRHTCSRNEANRNEARMLEVSMIMASTHKRQACTGHSYT
jgi:hypothetical protein